MEADSLTEALKRERGGVAGGVEGESPPADRLAEALDALAAARRTVSAARAALGDLGAALGAGRALDQQDLAELSAVAAALGDAARALGADPGHATLPELEARLAAWER